MFHYLFRKPGSPPEVPAGSRQFSSHRNSPVLALLGVLSLAVVIETFAVHLLVGRWSQVAAWILTAVSVYSLLFLIAHGRAITVKPHLVTSGELQVRDGLLWSANIPLNRIAELHHKGGDDGPPGTEMNAATLLQGNVAVTVEGGVELQGPYGIRKRCDRVRFLVDDPRKLEASLPCAAKTAQA